MKNKLSPAAFGYIREHSVSAVWHESLLQMVVYDLQTWNVFAGRVQPQFSTSYLNVGRNTLMTQMCDRWAAECSVFVIGDTDHQFTPEQAMHLVSLVDPVHRPIVSALYYACDQQGDQVRPVMLRRKDNGDLDTMWEFPADQLVEVDVVGMGLCAISVPWLLRMREANGDRWFDFDETVHGNFMPEDNAFCWRMQNFLGAKIHVHTGIVIGHEKTVMLRDEHARRTLKTGRKLPAAAHAAAKVSA